MDNKSLPAKLELGLYVSVFLIGVFCIWGAYKIHGNVDYDFYYDLLLGLGTNMTVVTIVFGIYKFFNSQSKVPDYLRGRLSDMASHDPGTIKRNYGAEDVQND